MGLFSRGREISEAAAELRLIASVAIEAIDRDHVAKQLLPDAYFIGFVFGFLETCVSPRANRSLREKDKERVVRRAFERSSLDAEELIAESYACLTCSDARYFSGRTDGAKVGGVWLHALHDGNDVKEAYERGHMQVRRMDYRRHGKLTIWQAAAVHLTEMVFETHIHSEYGG